MGKSMMERTHDTIKEQLVAAGICTEEFYRVADEPGEGIAYVLGFGKIAFYCDENIQDFRFYPLCSDATTTDDPLISETWKSDFLQRIVSDPEIPRFFKAEFRNPEKPIGEIIEHADKIVEAIETASPEKKSMDR